MRSVSNKWKQNQAQEFVGECDVKVIIDVTDPVAVADATATVNTLAYFSKPQQIMNDKDKDIKEQIPPLAQCMILYALQVGFIQNTIIEISEMFGV